MQQERKIVILEADALGKDISLKSLEQYGQVAAYPVTLQSQVAERIQDADIVIPNKVIINESVLKDALKVKLICEAATGYNNIDLAYCEKRGITVTNVRNYSTASVAQHTFSLFFGVYEKMAYYDRFVKDGSYGKTQLFSHFDRQFHELEGKTWGIVGLGNIGTKVAEIASAFGCHVVYYSASGNTYKSPYRRVEFDTLLKESDVISVHCPLTERTKYLFQYEQFQAMKKEAVLVNVARGPVIKEDDLARALQEGLIAGAGLDVFETEPIREDCPLLLVKDGGRLIMTPHIGWASLESRTRLVEDICMSIEGFINGRPRSVVFTNS